LDFPWRRGLDVTGGHRDKASMGGCFYEEVVAEALRSALVRTDMHVLVVCGGSTDIAVLRKRGFTNVTISKVGAAVRGRVNLPYHLAQGKERHLPQSPACRARTRIGPGSRRRRSHAL
jgi:hypothetical protein